MKTLKEISIHDISNVRIGHADDIENATGCSVIIVPDGAICGVDIRGGGPASRETALLDPCASNQGIHGLFLSGGSAYGLDCASGIMQYLEEKKIGLAVHDVIVPIVVGSCIFDLSCVSGTVRPDRQMGYRACCDSEKNRERNGNVGAGMGATVGKLYGMERCMKAGLGCFAMEAGALQVGAIVAVNAIGDVYDVDSRHQLAGLLDQTGKIMLDSEMEMIKGIIETHQAVTNTTIAAIITNARLDKAQMNKVAAMASNGIARTIRPVNTSMDGDTVYALTTGKVQASEDAVGTLASYVLAKAIVKAVKETDSLYGYRSAKDLMKE